MIAPRHTLTRLQADFDEEAAALRVRRYRLPSIAAQPQRLPRSEWLIGPVLALGAVLLLALAAVLP